MLKVWSEKELTLHLQSGVWEYKDTQKYSRVVSGSRGSTLKKVEAQLQAYTYDRAFSAR